jgi:hypothetical protein
MDNNVLIGLGVFVVICIVVLSLYFYFKSSTYIPTTTAFPITTSLPIITTYTPTTTAFPTTTPAATTPAATTPAATTPAPLYTSTTGKMRSNNTKGDYTCSVSTKRNKLGNDGDYANYCIFDKIDDATKQCDNDTDCIGFGKITGVTNGSQTYYYQLASKAKTISDSSSGGFTWYEKPTATDTAQRL